MSSLAADAPPRVVLRGADWAMTPPGAAALVGRAGEVRLLRTRLEATASGHGGLVVITGGPGTGKSRLAAEAQAVAGRAGMRVLVGRSPAVGPRCAFRPLVEALATALRDEGAPRHVDLGPYAAALGSILPEWSSAVPVMAPPAPVERFEAVLRLLRVLGGERGLLLVIEDLQWADRETVDLLEYLAAQLREQSLLCVCTARPEPDSVAVDLIRRLAETRTADTVHLEPLTDNAVDALAKSWLETTEVPGAVLDLLHRRSLGIPLAVEELLAAAVRSGALRHAGDRWVVEQDLPLDPPPTVAALVRAQLDRLSPPATTLVQVLALLGPGTEPTVLAGAAGSSEETLTAALHEVVDVGLLRMSGDRRDDALSFTSSLLPEVVLHGLLPAERRRIAGDCLAAVRAASREVREGLAARAAELCEWFGDPIGAAREAVLAGRHALRTGNLRGAERLLRRAAELAEGHAPLRLAIEEQLVTVLTDAGKATAGLDVGASLARHLVESRNPLRRLIAAHLDLARAGAMGAIPGLAGVQRDAARGLATQAGDRAGLARVHALDADALLQAGHGAAAAEMARTVIDTPDAPADARVRALGVLAWTARASTPIAADGLLDQAVQLAGGDGLVADALALDGHVAAVRASTTAEINELRDVIARADAAGMLGLRADLDLRVAWLHLLRGEITEGRTAAVRCRTTAEELGLRLRPMAMALEARAHALTRDGADAEALVHDVLVSTRAGSFARAVAVGEARGQLLLIREERADAFDALDAAVTIAGERDLIPPVWFTGAHALLAVSLGRDAGEARDALLASRTTWARWNAGYLAAVDAVAAGRAGRPDTALTRAGEAHQLLSVAPWCQHHTALLLAEAALSDGWGEPGNWLREALTFFGDAGQRDLARTCKSLLQEAGETVPRRGRGTAEVPLRLRGLGVTSREMDVLELVAQGLPNADIAARLYLSPRTVKSHVTSLLRKTRAANRRALAELVDVTPEVVDLR